LQHGDLMLQLGQIAREDLAPADLVGESGFDAAQGLRA
jgi:hypothetical protein